MWLQRVVHVNVLKKRASLTIAILFVWVKKVRFTIDDVIVLLVIP